jgi:hypothetical protein
VAPLFLSLPRPEWLAGYVTTIIEIADRRKCRLASDSIAPRYAAAIGMLRCAVAIEPIGQRHF